MARMRLSAMKTRLAELQAKVAELEVTDVEQLADKVDSQPADAKVLDKAEEIVKEESKVVEESISDLSGEKVDQSFDYDSQNTKMSSEVVAEKLIKLAKAILA